MRLSQIVFSLSLLGCCVQAGAQNNTAPAVDDAAQQKKIDDGARLMREGKAAEALAGYLDPLIAAHEATYRARPEKIYSARTPTESLSYLAEAANKQSAAVVLSSSVSYAYFLKSYALIELHRVAEARPFLDTAVAMAPHNAQFLAELGNRYQNDKNWSKALETYQLAEDAATSYSLPELKNAELARAWRGKAFVNVELHRLAEAEQLYLRCLELNGKDKTAASELLYVRGLQAKQGN